MENMVREWDVRGVREREGKSGVRGLELGEARGERWCERGRVE